MFVIQKLIIKFLGCCAIY